MARSSAWLSAVWGGVLTLVGCAPSIQDRCLAWAGAPPGLIRSEVLPVCERGNLAPELNSPLLAQAEANAPGQPKGLPIYCRLRAHECQCLAVQVSTVANLLDQEALAGTQQAAACKIGSEKACQAAALKAKVFSFLALEDRNRSAARALDAYTQLGEAEANWDLLQLTLSRVTSALGKARDVKAKGLPSPVADALSRQQLDLQARGVRLRVQILQFNSELRRLLGFDPCGDEWRVWPVDAFHLAATPIDPQAAVAVALAHRPELLLLALLEAEASAGNLAPLREQLRALESALGQAPPAQRCPRLEKLLAKLCGSSAEDAEAEVRLRQLRELHAQRERKVVEEVGQAARAAQAQAEVVVLTQKIADNWRDRAREAEDKEAKGLGAFAETIKAQVDWLEARGDVVKEATRLQRALIQLRQAQGTLPLDCAPQALPTSFEPCR